MLIDWFTVVAQLLNFLALIWLLKRFLYQPILNALDAREQKITAQLAESEAKTQAAQAERDEFFRKNQEFEEQRAELLKSAMEEVKIERQRLLDEARAETELLRSKQQEILRTEQQSLIASISRRTQTQVLAIARQALQDLANVDLENYIVAVFIEKLYSLPEAETQQILLAVKNSAAPLIIRTGFELSTAQQLEISQAVEKILSTTSAIEFATSAHLITGVELSSDGHKFSWSVADYLATWEKNLDVLVQSHL